MAARASWSGHLRLSLVSVPVKGYPATNASARISLNQLHATCHSRIKYQKVCPIHGEVPKEEIVSGYEYAKDQYVIVEPGELDQLRTESDRAVAIDAVVPAAKLSPLYFSDKTYYLAPDGKVAEKPFVLIHHCLEADKLCAIARVTLFGREELVAVRAVEQVLAMTTLKYEAQVVHPEEVPSPSSEPDLNKKEVDLTKTLLKTFLKPKIDLGEYTDLYQERLKALIDAKVEGKELVTPPEAEQPQVINLMDALRKSVASASKPARSGKKAPAPKTSRKARRKSG
jgi:DNA end-binding protein Ku